MSRERTHKVSFARVLLLRGGAVERLMAEAARPRGRIFAYQNQRFVLNFRLRGAGEVAFDWRPLDGGLFPAVSGIARVHQLGPLAGIVLRATYAPAADAVSELLSAALGKRPARAALRGAGLAMAKLAADRNLFVFDRLSR